MFVCSVWDSKLASCSAATLGVVACACLCANLRKAKILRSSKEIPLFPTAMQVLSALRRRPLLVMCGPCVNESLANALSTQATKELGNINSRVFVPIFASSENVAGFDCFHGHFGSAGSRLSLSRRRRDLECPNEDADVDSGGGLVGRIGCSLACACLDLPMLSL